MNLRDDAISIWTAAVNAVNSKTLIRKNVVLHGSEITIGNDIINLNSTNRIEVVGAGKAGAGMARGLLSVLSELPSSVELSGWVNVPEDCVVNLPKIHLHGARPAGINEPTADGVNGSQEIIRRIESLDQNDVCIVLISGGGSALLPAPVPEITLESKLAVTRFLAKSGATINELNTVRRQLSLVKGGGLLKRCKAGKLIALIISDVIGDPLDIIASGPTVPANSGPDEALAVLKKYDIDGQHIPPEVYFHLETQASNTPTGNRPSTLSCSFSNYIIGSNQIAMAAAEAEANAKGYCVINLGSQNSGHANQHGIAMFGQLQDLQESSNIQQPCCILAGGETTVELAETARLRKGGRNQEVVLAAIAKHSNPAAWKNMALFSGGTDGEDGPTDAAGAVADEQLVQAIVERNISAGEYLAINNSYPFFEQAGGLLRTGPTHTNVMDIAVGIWGGPNT